ncbi:hypothetical protein [Catenulispora rubra]|uniref:hypothetical protein n=1 Tax=Catenulispora rubra TaxID=280293 RepID=UPI001E32A02F|nr:hypothetical protein [Catenulispora rubra]
MPDHAAADPDGMTFWPEAAADAERRYAARYGEPGPNPLRVVIEIEVRRALGAVKVRLPETETSR